MGRHLYAYIWKKKGKENLTKPLESENLYLFSHSVFKLHFWQAGSLAMLHERSWDTGRGLFIWALGYFAFLQSKGIWGLFCRLAMSCAIPTVSRDSSKDGVWWGLHGKSAFIRSTSGKRKNIELRKKAFSGQDNNSLHLCLSLGQTLVSAYLSPLTSQFFLEVTSLYFSGDCISWLLIRLYHEIYLI